MVNNLGMASTIGALAFYVKLNGSSIQEVRGSYVDNAHNAGTTKFKILMESTLKFLTLRGALTITMSSTAFRFTALSNRFHDDA